MKKEIDKNEWIDAYLKGELPAGEARKFEERIKTDPEFAREVNSVKELHEIIMDSTLLDIKNQLSTIHLQRINKIKWIKRITGIGLGGIAIGFFIFFFTKNDTEPDQISFSVKTSDSTYVIQNTRSTLSHNDSIIKHEANNIIKKELQESILKKNKTLAAKIDEATKNIKATKKDSTIKQTDVKNNDEEKIENEAPAENKTIKINPETSLKTDIPGKVDCSKVKINAEFTSEKSCNNKPTGSITIIEESITGGKMPYLFALNNINYSKDPVFSNLYSDIYALYIKDANNCRIKVSSIVIESIDCLDNKTYVFSPVKGEVWEIPVKPDGKGVIQIFSKSGVLVYTAKVSSNDPNVWNGENLNRQPEPMGVYQFVIKYTDGEIASGNVTVVK